MPSKDWAENRDKKSQAQANKRGKGRRGNGGVDEPLTLTLLDWLQLVALQRAAMSQGGAVRVGLTRDGGALAIGVYIDQDYGTEYIRPSEDLNTALVEIADAWLKQGASTYSEHLDAVSDELARHIMAQAKKPDKPT